MNVQPILGYPRTYLVLFERDEGGSITRPGVSGTGVRKLRFAKTLPSPKGDLRQVPNRNNPPRT